MPSKPTADLGLFFDPRSIAILGASSDPDKIGGVPVALLKRAGFPGRILPVNPTQPHIQGLPAYPSVRAIEGDIDLAVIALPAKLAFLPAAAAAGNGFHNRQGPVGAL